jgi:Arc/MetJ-type ribon-helix-helix transcriptional regulator
LDAEFIGELDRLIEENYFQNRSQAIRDAVREKLARMKRSRLFMECAKLDPKFEKAMAEEGLDEDVSQWPEY